MSVRSVHATRFILICLRGCGWRFINSLMLVCTTDANGKGTLLVLADQYETGVFPTLY